MRPVTDTDDDEKTLQWMVDGALLLRIDIINIKSTAG
jgi:hypothetical protein